MGNKVLIPSPTPHRLPFPAVSSEGGNPSGSSQVATAGHVERKDRLPHEVCDHSDVDLSACLVHLWNHSVEVGVCETIAVRGSLVSAPLGGGALMRAYWLTLGGDTHSFSQVLQAPQQPRRSMDRR
jgi:hypothetical protein